VVPEQHNPAVKVSTQLGAGRLAQVTIEVLWCDSSSLVERQRRQGSSKGAGVRVLRSFAAILGDDANDLHRGAREQQIRQTLQVASVEGFTKCVEGPRRGVARYNWRGLGLQLAAAPVQRCLDRVLGGRQHLS